MCLGQTVSNTTYELDILLGRDAELGAVSDISGRNQFKAFLLRQVLRLRCETNAYLT